MNTRQIQHAAGGALLAMSSLASSLASAHGSGIEASTLHHYMTSPDHVITFCLLALAAYGIGVWAWRGAVKARRGAVKAIQRHKR